MKPNRLQPLPAARPFHQILFEDLAGYNLLAHRIRELAGIEMPPTAKNRTLMACRLAPLMKRRGCQDYLDYNRLLHKDEVNQEFISALTTHTTDFFREAQHFRMIPSVLEQIQNRKQKDTPDIRTWCSAASTGQEAYTLLMALQESLLLTPQWNLKFLATDIDRVALIRASEGRYRSDEVKKIPPHLLQKYFRYLEKQSVFIVKDRYREAITFAEFNLAQNLYPFQYLFDIVFCRNVLIYLGHREGERVVDKIVNVLAPGGFFFVGHSETGFVKNQKLRLVAAAVFQKVQK